MAEFRSITDHTRLLHDESNSYDDISEKFESRRDHTRITATRILLCIIILLLTCNAALLAAFLLGSHRCGSDLWPEVAGGQDFSYFGAPQTVMTPFSHDWVGLHAQENETYRYKDEEWGDALFPRSGGSVALSADFIKRYNLPEDAAPTPENDGKRIYTVSGYHQLHCLDVMRDSIYYLNGTLTEWPDKDGFLWDHVLHCIEAVRKGLSCFLDPTLINLNETWPGIPNGQMHQCRNRDALYKFVTENGHALPVDPHAHSR